jgi:NAD(P)H-hydrate epimerase
MPDDSLTFPALTADEMAAVDRAMFSVCGLDVLQVMEVAGRAVASWVRKETFGGDCSGRHVLVLCGTGGNGGDGMVAARYLAGWGATAAVALAARPEHDSVTAHQLRVVEALNIPVSEPDAFSGIPEPDLIIDGLLGFSGSGNPRGEVARLIELANNRQGPTVAIDLPSGLDATTGIVNSPCIRATATITLGLPKTGILAEAARPVTGRVVVADIGIPNLAFRSAGVEQPDITWTEDWLPL